MIPKETAPDILRHEFVNGLLSVKGVLAAAVKCSVKGQKGRFLPENHLRIIEQEIGRAIEALDRFLGLK
jgi:hypothetical protein